MCQPNAGKFLLFLVLIQVLVAADLFAARIVSVKTCEKVTDPGMEAVGVRTEFTPLSPEIHALVKMKDVKPGSKLKGSWVAVDAIEEPNYVINSSEVTFEEKGDATAHFQISKPTNGWPPGKYKLDLFFEGVFIGSAPFRVKTAPQDGSPKSALELVSILTCESVSGEDQVPESITDEFRPDSPEIHVVAAIKNVKPGMKARGVWISIDAIATPNYEIKSLEMVLEKEGTANVHFQLSKPTNGWPSGKYRFDLYVDGAHIGSAPFAVEGMKQSEATQGNASPAAPQAVSGTMDFGAPQVDPKRMWTIAVYLGGDNDLEPFALKDIKEMERGLPDEGVECIVFVDRAKGYSTEDGDWTTARVLRIRKAGGGKSRESEVIASPGEVNMGDPALLQSFLASVLKTYPAQHHALILWDHGGGWTSHVIDSDAPGGRQGSDKLTLPELRDSISGGLKEANVKKLDMVGFDMCLMAQLETASQIADLADIMVASQAVEPGDGWPYEQLLPSFGKESLGTRRLAAQIVETFGKFYGERKERIATLSAIDLAEVQKLVGALDALSAKMYEAVPKNWQEISRCFFYAESYADRTDIRKGNRGLGSIDLLDALNRMHHSVTPFPAEKEYQEIVGIMDRAVIATYVSPRHRLSHGLAIYAPVTGKQFNAEYETLSLTQSCSWPKLLKAVHQTQEKNLSSPRITDIKVVDAQSGQPVKGGKPGGGFRVEATVEGENVLWVQYLQAIRDEKNKGTLILEKSYVLDPEYHKKRVDAVSDVVDLIMPEFKGTRNKVTQEFIGKHLVVTNGEKTSRATIDQSSLSDLEHVSVPVLIQRKGMEKHFATVFFNSVTWQAVNVVGEIPQPDSTVAYRQIQPQPEDEVTMLFEFLPDEGNPGYLQAETMKWKDGLEFLIDVDSPGDTIVAMRAESIGGQSAFAKTNIKVEEYSKEEKGYVENARKVKMKDLVGTWTWHALKDGKWQPTPAYTEIVPSKSNPDMLVATIKNPSDSQWKPTSQIVLLDTRLMPMLRLISVDESGRPVEAMNFTLLVSRWEQGSPRMVLKYLVPKGWLILWAKGKGGAAPAASGATTPAASNQGQQPSTQQQSAQAAPQQAVNPLIGIWQSEDEEVLRIGDSAYEAYEFSQMVDQGTYEVRGSQIITRSVVTGERERYTFKVKGRKLTLRDSDGETYHYVRVQ